MIDKRVETIQHAWGTSRHLYDGVVCDLALAIGKAGGASSLHYHARKTNVFFVLSGCVRIERPGLPTMILWPGDYHCSPAGEKHRMVFLLDSELLEFYVAAPGNVIDPDDITRLDKGRKASLKIDAKAKSVAPDPANTEHTPGDVTGDPAVKAEPQSVIPPHVTR